MKKDFQKGANVEKHELQKERLQWIETVMFKLEGK